MYFYPKRLTQNEIVKLNQVLLGSDRIYCLNSIVFLYERKKWTIHSVVLVLLLPVIIQYHLPSQVKVNTNFTSDVSKNARAGHTRVSKIKVRNNIIQIANFEETANDGIL